MAFVGEDDGSFSACLAQFLSATEAAFERSQATLTSMLEEMRELRAESRQICRAFEEGVLQDLAAFREAFGKKDEILLESQQGGFVSPIPEPQNIESEIEIPTPPVLGKIRSHLSPFVRRVQFKDLPTRTVDALREFAFDGSSRDTQLFDPGGIDCVKDCVGFFSYVYPVGLNLPSEVEKKTATVNREAECVQPHESLSHFQLMQPRQDVATVRVWEPGGLPAKLDKWDWPEKCCSHGEVLQLNSKPQETCLSKCLAMFTTPAKETRHWTVNESISLEVITYDSEHWKNDRLQSHTDIFTSGMVVYCLDDLGAVVSSSLSCGKKVSTAELQAYISRQANHVWEPGIFVYPEIQMLWLERVDSIGTQKHCVAGFQVGYVGVINASHGVKFLKLEYRKLDIAHCSEVHEFANTFGNIGGTQHQAFDPGGNNLYAACADKVVNHAQWRETDKYEGCSNVLNLATAVGVEDKQASVAVFQEIIEMHPAHLIYQPLQPHSREEVASQKKLNGLRKHVKLTQNGMKFSLPQSIDGNVVSSVHCAAESIQVPICAASGNDNWERCRNVVTEKKRKKQTGSTSWKIKFTQKHAHTANISHLVILSQQGKHILPRQKMKKEPTFWRFKFRASQSVILEDKISLNRQVHFMEGNQFMPTLMMMLFFNQIWDPGGKILYT